MTLRTAATLLVYCLMGGAAIFQAALALGTPWGRCAYGGRATTPEGRLPARLRVASAVTVLVLATGAYVTRAGLAWAAWAFAGLFAVNTAANLSGSHPVERWLMSAVTLALTVSFAVLALG